MNSSESTHSGENNSFDPVEGMTQQPYPSFWYQNPAYNPSFGPGAGFRSGSLYFPHSVVPSEYPGFLVPQCLLPTALNRRPTFPAFPVCYNPAHFWNYGGYGKTMNTKETQTELPQMQHKGISCESWGVPANPHEGEDLITYKGEQRAVQSEQHHDLRHGEMIKSGLTMEVGKEKGYVAVPQFLPPPDEVKDRDEIHNPLNSDLNQPTGGVSKLQQEKPLCLSTEAVKDLSAQSRSQKPPSIGEREPDSSIGSHGFPEKWDEEEVGEQDSSPQGAQFHKVDEAIQCDGSWWEDVELEQYPDSSPGGSRKGTGEKSVQYEELGEEVGEQDSSLQGAQFDKADKAIQCDRSYQDAELEQYPESSPGGSRKGTGEKSVQYEELDEEEVGEQDSYAQGAQLDKVDEAIQCDESWWEDAELDGCSKQMPWGNAWAPDYTMQESRKKSRRNRKLKTADQAQSILSHKTVYLKRNTVLHIVVPNDSDDTELEEEEYEEEWLFEEDSSMSSSKEKFYREALKISKVSRLPMYPKPIWPWHRRIMSPKNKYAEYENIPLLTAFSRDNTQEILFSKLGMQHMPEQEGSSQESLECK